MWELKIIFLEKENNDQFCSDSKYTYDYNI